MKSSLQFTLAAICLFPLSGLGQPVELILGSDRNAADHPVVIPLSVDNSAGIIGAAFFVYYDISNLEMTVTSQFFSPFARQLRDAGDFDDVDNFSDVAEVQFDSPIVTTDIGSSGTTVSAVRLTPADGTLPILFNLSFALREDAQAGSYFVDIGAINVFNPSAGYPPPGRQIPSIVGFDGTDYSPLLPPGETSLSIASNIEFVNEWIDSDDNGLPDAWELVYSEVLGTFSDSSDFDMDGLNDKVEYSLGTNPKVKDAPGVLRLVREAGSYNFYFPVRNNSAFPFSVEWSIDAINWSGTGVSSVTRQDLESPPDTVLFQSTISAEDAPAFFTRLVLFDD